AGIGARLSLGHRVGVAALAAQRGDQVSLDLLGRALHKYVVGARHVPVEAARHPPELLVDQEPLEHRPALAAVLGCEPPRVQTGGDRLVLDHLDCLLGEPAAALFGLELERDQHVFHERTRALLELELVGGERLIGDGGGDCGAHLWSSLIVASSSESRRRSGSVRRAPRPGSASSRLWWFEITAIATSRARATSGSGSPAR